MARYRDEDWLRERYWEDGATQREIAEECDVSPRTIRTYMNRFDIPTRDIEGENHPLYGEERDDAVKERISDTLDGREFTEEWRRNISEAQRGSDTPSEVREKIAESLSGLNRSERTRRKMSESTAGEQNPNWRGGYSDRYGPGWSVANDFVRQRDECCRYCGVTATERQLHVHHVVPVRLFRKSDSARLKQAHDVRNLLLLCHRCHPRAEHGLIEPPTPEGFEEWRDSVEL